MDRHFKQVHTFHAAAGVEMPKEPTVLSNDEETSVHISRELEYFRERMNQFMANEPHGEVLPRAVWILEELTEFMTAGTIEDQVDALGDMMYFILGTFTLMGVKPERIMDIIAGANLGKILPNGSVLRHPETGKIMKPDGWKEKFAPEPLIRAEIEKQRIRANCQTCKGEGEYYYGLDCPDCN